LPEELPTTETLELAHTVRTELQMPLGVLVVNGVVPRLFSSQECEQLARADSAGRLTAIHGERSVIAAAVRRAQQERLQEESIDRLGSVGDVRRIDLPRLLEEAATPKAIRRLSEYF
jgi:hypothetical protein